MLGVALAYAWAAYPYTAFTLETNSNDSLVAVACVAALLALTLDPPRAKLSALARGAAVGAGAAAKFAPLALAPLFATAPSPRRTRVALVALGLLAVLAVTVLPYMPHGGVRELYDRTVGYQAGRPSPFSVWGQAPVEWLHTVVKVAVAALAVGVAFVPREKSPRQVAALGAAVLIGLQLVATHWFYLYVVWFAPFVLVALMTAYERPPEEPPAPGPLSGGSRGRARLRRAAALALAVLAAGWAISLWVPPASDDRVNDLYVYRSFAAPVLHGELPYRDVFFEYPPLAAPAIALPGVVGTGEQTFRYAFAAWMLLAAAALVLLCGLLAARTGGDPRRAMLAAALTPLLTGAMVRTHFDLVPVVLVLGALALLVARPAADGHGGARPGGDDEGLSDRGRPPGAGLGRGARGPCRGPSRGCGARGNGGGDRRRGGGRVPRRGVGRPAIPDGSPGADREHGGERALRPRRPGPRPCGARGEQPLGRPGASRRRGQPAPSCSHFCCALVAVLTMLAARRPAEPRALVLSCLTAVAGFAVLGKVLSPQFLVWLVPLGALAFAWRMDTLGLAVALAVALTQLEFPAHYFDLRDREPLVVALVCLRNGVLLGGARAGRARATAGRGEAPGRCSWPARPRHPRLAPRSATGPPSRSRSEPG